MTTRQAYSFDGGICARRSRTNFSRYLALQAWAGTPAGKPTVIDGPFAETKELIAGFSMIQVKSKQEAIEWVKRWPALDADGHVEIEIRQLFEAEDFGPEFTPEMREEEEEMRTQLKKKES